MNNEVKKKICWERIKKNDENNRVVVSCKIERGEKIDDGIKMLW